MHVLPFNKFSKGSFKILFLGDLMGENLVLSTLVNSEPFVYLERWIASHDYVVGNLETTFSGNTSDYPYFSTSDIYADVLSKFVNLLFTANNHSLDFEKEGALRTIEVLKDFSLDHIGTSKPGSIKKIFDVTLSNHKLTFQNYTQFINEKAKQKIQQGPDTFETCAELVSIYNKTQVEENVKRAKERSEFVFVGIHQSSRESLGGGYCEELEREPTTEQKRFLENICEMGADIVIGGHPHYFQGGKLTDEGGIIVYSLGNFYGTMSSEKYPLNCGCAMIMNCDGYSNTSYSFLPVATVKEQETGNFYTIPLAPLEAGAYPFIDKDQRITLLEELEKIRKTLRKCNLTEEEILVQLL